jgi:quercetin dioxygenase-like cupin family protein
MLSDSTRRTLARAAGAPPIYDPVAGPTFARLHSGALMPVHTPVRRFRWDDMPKERVNDSLDRRLISGDRIMLAHVYLKKGCVVPRHAHDNEQITYVLSGALRFWIGDDEAETFIVGAGDVLHIPSNVPHKAEAVEDTLDVDVFSPPRQDWLDKTDAYLRGK